MAARMPDLGRAPVAFGRWSVPLLFAELQQPEAERRLRALASLCDLVHDNERVQQTVNGGFLDQLKVLIQDEDPSIRAKTCEFLQVLSAHHTGRLGVLRSSLLPPLSLLVDDSSSSCRRSAHRVLNRLSLLPEGVESLLTLVPALMRRLREEQQEEEEEEVLLLSTLSSCFRLDPVPALDQDAISLLGPRLSHRSVDVRREAAAAMMALSVNEGGKQRLCKGAVLPVLVQLLQDEDLEVQTSAAGALMYTSIITAGKRRCLDLDVVPVLLDLLARKQEGGRGRGRKALTLYSLRTLTSLAEAPDGRRLLLEQLPLLEARSEASEEDQDVRRAAQTAIRVITWAP
ncbi:uncharacterized protein V6R79_021360 [Siganus canaliculatus]